ncbi:MAG TPA: DUF2141 domain-containing protein [Sphingobium sp.]
MPLLLVANSAPPTQPPAPAPTSTAQTSGVLLTISFVGLRSTRGLVRGCLTRDPAAFPDKCEKDPRSLKATIPAAPHAIMRFTGVPSGDYALSILHDENANGRLDTMLGIPKEGVGFSENPALHFSAPKFAAARFHVGSEDVVKEVRIKYFL